MRPLPTLAFGGDYNPEQWSVEVQLEDVELMKRAGVSLVNVAVFSWALLERSPGEFTFGWLDDVLERLQHAGIGVDLANATASPPPWLARMHPEMLPVTEDGTVLWPGGRQAYCPSSPVYAEHSLRLTHAMAERYGEHPAVVLWHVNNEIGCHNALCYCDTSAAAFRTWLRRRYHDDLDRLNDAWGTAFWSQHYYDWEEILPPRVAPNFPNPTQQLDFRRFSSDALLDIFCRERDAIREHSRIPITTNLMVMHNTEHMDYFAWGPELDIVSNDHYQLAADPESFRELAFSADLTRGTAGGRPWLLMETSTSAVNWQPRNVAKRPGELLRATVQHVARGADGVMFFQWRASRAGAEKYHSALVPHAGTDTRLFGEVEQLGAVLARLGELAGSLVDNRVAMLFDWSARWGSELDSHPSVDFDYLEVPAALHGALFDLGVGVDVVPPDRDLSGYRLILVPNLYLVSDAAAAAIAAAAAAGATVLVTYFSGITDEQDHIRLGGYPGAFRDLLGIRVEEFTPLREGERVLLDDGRTGSMWTEDLRLAGAQALVRYADGPVPGVPAITRNDHGQGTGWYLATRLDRDGWAGLVEQLVTESGVAAVRPTRPGVEVARRSGADGRSWLFCINHTEAPAELPAGGFDLVGQQEVVDTLQLAAGAVAVVREH